MLNKSLRIRISLIFCFSLALCCATTRFKQVKQILLLWILVKWKCLEQTRVMLWREKNNNRSRKINNFYDIFMFRFSHVCYFLTHPPPTSSRAVLHAVRSGRNNTININFYKSFLSLLLLKAFCAMSLSTKYFECVQHRNMIFHLFYVVFPAAA